MMNETPMSSRKAHCLPGCRRCVSAVHQSALSERMVLTNTAVDCSQSLSLSTLSVWWSERPLHQHLFWLLVTREGKRSDSKWDFLVNWTAMEILHTGQQAHEVKIPFSQSDSSGL